MKEISKKNKIIGVLIAIIIIAGIIITLTIGLKFDIRYQATKKIELYIGKDFEISDIKQITQETIPNQDIMIQKVEVYDDTVSIISNEITEEQKANIINKVNEKYETEISEESTEITTIPHTRGRDIIKPYIWAFAISTGIILIYMAIRYYKIGIIKTIAKTVITLGIAQAILLSIIAIARIPVGRLTIPMVLTVYILSLLGITTNLEKKLEEKKNEKEKD